MASTPHNKETIELHIGASEINLYAMAVMDRILIKNVLISTSHMVKLGFEKIAVMP